MFHSRYQLSPQRLLVMTAVSGLLLAGLPQLAKAQSSLQILESKSPWFAVSDPVPAGATVEHTGAGVTHSIWYDAANTSPGQVCSTGNNDVLEAFCWDEVQRNSTGTITGSAVKISWRYRSKNSPYDSSDPMYTRNQGAVITIADAYDPDVAVVALPYSDISLDPGYDGTRPNIPVPANGTPAVVKDGRGCGVVNIIVGYQAVATGQAKIRVYQLAAPVAHVLGTPLPVVYPVAGQLDHYDGALDAGITVGEHVNVDGTQSGEFVATWVRPASATTSTIMSRIFRSRAVGGSPTGPVDFIRDAIGSNIGRFAVTTTVSGVKYVEPDVAASFLANTNRTESRIAYTFIRQAAGRQAVMVAATTFDRAVAVSGTPQFEVAEGSLGKPRICMGPYPIDAKPYTVAFEEHKVIMPSCDLLISGPTPLNLISTLAGSITSGLAAPTIGSAQTNSFTIGGGRHINQCLARFGNSEPVVAMEDNQAVVLWRSSPGSNSNDPREDPLRADLLDGDDILAHRLLSSGVGAGLDLLLTPYATGGTHIRVNSQNTTLLSTNDNLPANQATGDQVAPSVAIHPSLGRTVTMWYDGQDRYVKAHDDAEYSGDSHYYRQTTGGGKHVVAPAEATGTASSVNLVPNPSGFGGVLQMELRPGEQIQQIVVMEINSGRVVVATRADKLSLALPHGQRVELPLKKLVPGSLTRGFYTVKVITSQSTYTKRLAFEPTEK